MSINDKLKSSYISLQRSVGGHRMLSANSKKEPCDSRIYSVQFEPPWLFCAFLSSHWKGSPQDSRGTQRWRTNGEMVLLFGKRARRLRHNQRTLTTTTPEEVAMANQKIPPNTDREELDLDAILEQQQLHDKVQNILESDDKELITALDVTLGALENMLPGKEGE